MPKRPKVSARKQKVLAAKKRAAIVSLVALALVASAVALGTWYAIGIISSGPKEDVHASKRIVMHIHVRLRIIILGEEVKIPANIGIDPQLWKDHKYDEYGMPGMYPIHTHDETGTIHIESTVARDYTLGDFFDVWGVPFSESCIFNYCNDGVRVLKMYVNGRRSYDFRNLMLRDGMEILIEYG